MLVTHYMDEAERLCDRAALIDRGRLVALGTPDELAEKAGGRKRVCFLPSAAFGGRLLTRQPEVNSVEHQGQMSSSTLEDAFVALTGRHAHHAEDGDAP